MAVLAVQDIVQGGLAPTYAAAAGGGDSFDRGASGRYFLHVKNTNAATRDVTIAPGNPNSQINQQPVSIGSIVVTVAANTGDVMIGPLTSEFGDATGSVAITYSAVTNLTVAVIRMP